MTNTAYVKELVEITKNYVELLFKHGGFYDINEEFRFSNSIFEAEYAETEEAHNEAWCDIAYATTQLGGYRYDRITEATGLDGYEMYCTIVDLLDEIGY